MLILSGVFIVIGVVLILGTAVFRYYFQGKEKYQGRADGQVVDLVVDKPDQEGERAGIHHYYYPVIAYYANGLLFKERYEKGSNPSEFRMNQHLKICFNLEKPYHFKILEKDPRSYLLTAVYLLGFLFCIAGGITFLLFATRG